MTEGVQEEDWEGTVFAKRYAVQTRVGSGASATVYRARDLERDTQVALKISRPFLLTKHRRAARFLREVQAVQRIEHPGCVQVLDWGIDADCAYIAMEFIEGGDLYDFVRREAPMSARRALSIAAEICDVLEAAHGLGVVHRDLKPKNVMLVSEERGRAHVKVLDFGLAKLMRFPTDDESTLPVDLTRAGAVLGTPHYMAPEQILGGDIDGRADLYAISVILYELLTARRPLEEPSTVRALVAIGTVEPTPPSVYLPDIDPQLEELLLFGLRKKPEERFQTAAQMAHALRTIAQSLDGDEQATALYTQDPEPRTRIRSAADDDDDDGFRDEQLTSVRRPRATDHSSDETDDVPLTRVYRVNEPRRAPRMVAKDRLARPSPVAPAPLRTRQETGPDDSDEHDETVVIGGTAAAQYHRQPPPREAPSEMEKGLRAALATIVLAAFVAILGRWLQFW